MLAVSLNQIKNSPYYFCPNRDCAAVYFSEDGLQTFHKNEVRERVYQKEPEAADVFVCYCFQHTVGEVLNTTPEGHTTILDDINAGIKAQQCACDLRNPQGSCCLGNVRSVIKRAEISTAIAV
jgi:hypothetical protein